VVHAACEAGDLAAGLTGAGVDLSPRTGQRRDEAALDLQPQPKCLDGVDQFADGGRPVEITPPGPLAVAMNAWSTFVPSV